MAKRLTFSGDRLRRLALPNAGREYVYDDQVRGLALEMSATGAKSFRVYRKFKGRPVKITLGTFDPDLPETRELPAGAEPLDLLGNQPALNTRMARKLAVAVMAELDTGINPAEERTRRGITLGELFNRYIADRRAEGIKTVPALVWHWERYLGQLPPMDRKKHGEQRTKAPGSVNWQHRHITEISHSDIARLRLDLAEQISRTTSNRVMELLSAMFNFARKARLHTGENPVEGNSKFSLPSRERFLHADEAQRFFAALDAEETGRDFADYVRISLFCGARRGNVLRMRWDELSLDGARWAIAGEKMKNGEVLTIPLVQEAIDILRRRAETANGNPWVFPGRTSSGHLGPQRKQWENLLKRAGLTDLRVHDMRRSLGSWMASNGASTTITMRALGHRSFSAALVYQRLAADPVRAEMQRAVTALVSATTPKAGELIKLPGKKRTARG